MLGKRAGSFLGADERFDPSGRQGLPAATSERAGGRGLDVLHPILFRAAAFTW